MRRPFVITLVVLLLIIAATAGWFYTRPTTLTVQALLTPDGRDVTGALDWSVQRITAEADPGQAIRINLMETIKASGSGPHQFQVPADEPILISAAVPGGENIEERFTAPRWQAVERRYVLDAGEVRVTLTSGEATLPRLRLTRPDSTGLQILDLPADGHLSLFPSPGELYLQTEGGPIQDSATVMVVTGEVVDVSLDVRARDVDFRLIGDLPVDNGLPPGRWSLTPAGAEAPVREGAVEPDGGFRVADLAHGEYRVRVRFDTDRQHRARHLATEAPVMVDADTDAVTLPLAFFRVAVTLGEATPAGAVERFSVVETGYKGMPYAWAPAPAPGESVTLAVAPHPEDPESQGYAVMAWDDDHVVGAAPLGPVVSGTRVETTVTLGEGLVFCQELYDAGTCGNRAVE